MIQPFALMVCVWAKILPLWIRHANRMRCHHRRIAAVVIRLGISVRRQFPRSITIYSVRLGIRAGKVSFLESCLIHGPSIAEWPDWLDSLLCEIHDDIRAVVQ